MTRRKIVLMTGIVAFTVVALHPPWMARAVLTRMSFSGFPNAPPQTVIDSVAWRVPFAPVYSPPSLDLPPEELKKYQARLVAGDTTAAVEWRRRIESLERRYHVPEKQRSVWRRDTDPGSRVPTFAFTRSVVSARFSIDRTRLLLYLLAVAIATGLAVTNTPRQAGHG